jgi:hypothetical protein
LQQTAIIVGGILIWHFAALSSMALYAGIFVESSFLAPKRVLVSRSHKLGLLAAICAAGITVFSNAKGIMDYGIIVATFLLLFDAFMIFKAVKSKSLA